MRRKEGEWGGGGGREGRGLVVLTLGLRLPAQGCLLRAHRDSGCGGSAGESGLELELNPGS